MEKQINWTRIDNDKNGNPRYVCHYLQLLTQDEIMAPVTTLTALSGKYTKALHRAKQIGGKKFHNKQYGGGIVFQSYSLKDTERAIAQLLADID